MVLATDLADVLRGAGQRVREHDGWQDHHHGQMRSIDGLMWHHTATPASAGTDGPVGVVRDGRSDLPGPLAQLAFDRDLVWHVLSAGQAWHAGSGGPWHDIPANGGNPRLLGIEVLHAGTSAEGWPAARLDALRTGSAAIAGNYGFDPLRFLLGHKEWAPRRKVDPHGLNMDDERAAVARLLEQGDDDVPLDDRDLDRIRSIVRQEVEKQAQQKYHGRSLGEWWREAANASAQAVNLLKRE